MEMGILMVGEKQEYEGEEITIVEVGDSVLGLHLISRLQSRRGEEEEEEEAEPRLPKLRHCCDGVTGIAGRKNTSLFPRQTSLSVLLSGPNTAQHGEAEYSSQACHLGRSARSSGSSCAEAAPTTLHRREYSRFPTLR